MGGGEPVRPERAEPDRASTSRRSEPPRRRTQQERREATMSALVEAAIGAIAESGYQGATVAEVCRRAGLSQGALFRHFPSRRHLMVATADVCSARLVADLGDRLGSRTFTPGSGRDVMWVIRDLVRGRMNLVWTQLYEAARFDEELRSLLTPVYRVHIGRLVAAGSRVAGEDADQRRVRLAVHLLLNFLDGEARLLPLGTPPRLSDRSLEVMAGIWEELLGPVPDGT